MSRRSNPSASRRWSRSVSRRLPLSPKRRPTTRPFTSLNARARPNLRWPSRRWQNPNRSLTPPKRNPVRAIYRAIDGAADLSPVLDALVDGVGDLFPRAALFVVKTKSRRLQGWRSVGFHGCRGNHPGSSPAHDRFRADAGGHGRPDDFHRRRAMGAPEREAWTVTFPVTTGGRVVAVVHADGGARSGEAGGGVRPRFGARSGPHARADRRRTGSARLRCPRAPPSAAS